MKNFPFSFDDLSCANIILDNMGLYPDSFYMWAAKVKRWFDAFYDLAREYQKDLYNWQLSIKAVFQTLKSTGSHISRLLSKLSKDRDNILTKDSKLRPRFANFSTYQDDNNQTIKSRAGKWERRGKNGRKTSYLVDQFSQGYTVPAFYDRESKAFDNSIFKA
jgi:hypothetical protein